MTITFLDIDYTLIRPESKLAIIDKDNPSQIIMRINNSDEILMNSVWKKFNIKVQYNGKTFWLNPELLKSIKRHVDGITLNRIGISYRDWTDNELLNNQGFDFILHNLGELKDTNSSVSLLTARKSKKSHGEFLKKLKEEIKSKLRLSVVSEFFINDMEVQTNSDLTASRKAKIILEHLIGYKIKSNRFVNLKQSEYSDVKFYDDDVDNIDAVKNLQLLFETCLKNTDKELKNEIINKLKHVKLTWETCLVTNNDLNPFVKNNGILVLPQIDLFESFNRL
jgi:hypothetical protein